MKNANELEQKIASALQTNHITCINATLYPELGQDNSVGLYHVDDFLSFLQAENIKSVFCSCLEITADDYYITDETLIEQMGRYKAENLSSIVRKEIATYNKKIDRYDFGSLRHMLYFVIFNGFMIYYIFEDSVPFNDPSEVLENIIAANAGELAREQEQRKAEINALKEKFKQQILSDPEFAKMTNQKLRRSYTYELWTNLNGEYAPLKKYWTTGAGYWNAAMQDFIDLIWAEYKQSKKDR